MVSQKKHIWVHLDNLKFILRSTKNNFYYIKYKIN